MDILGKNTSPDKIALASAIMMALFNFGVFLCSSYEEIVGKVTGDALYMPIFIGAGVLAVFTVIYAIFSPMKQKE